MNEKSECVFLGGDAQNMAGTVAAAIGSGREAARKIHLYFRTGKRDEEKKKEPKIVRLEDLNLDYFEHKRRVLLELIPQFKEVMEGNPLQKEAERCFHCGACNMCGNCWMFCPDLAISEESGKYKINLDYCKGCLVCKEECPRGVINSEMEVK